MLALILSLFVAFLLVGAIAAVSQKQAADAALSQKTEELTKLEAQHATLKAANLKVMQRFGGVANLEEEKEKIFRELGVIRSTHKAEAERLKVLRKSLAVTEEAGVMEEFGFYQTKYDFITSSAYAAKLEEVRGKQKDLIKKQTAVTSATEWTVNGSKAEGKKQINQTIKLMLRAFNGESDAAVARVKFNNVVVMETRIKKTFDAVNALASVQQCRITPGYLDLKIQELHLAHEFQEKVQAEKEEQQRIRDEIRQEEIAQREFERAKADAEKKEREAMQNLARLEAAVQQAVGKEQSRLMAQIEALQKQIAEAQANQRAISQAQLTRSGFVYVISNIGSFGENIYKIGMTRRLKPEERVIELGDASVPFRFDIHAMISSHDAPKLENTLHRAFANRRVNAINERREFFRVTLAEIADVVKQNHGQIEFIETPDAREYRETLAKYEASKQHLNIAG